jgi:hypothetical protein
MHLEFWPGSNHLQDWEGARWIQLVGGSGMYLMTGVGVCGFESVVSVIRVVVN